MANLPSLPQPPPEAAAAEETLRKAFGADVTGILRAVRKKLCVPADPLKTFRASGYEAAAAKDRAARRKEMGISSTSSYA